MRTCLGLTLTEHQMPTKVALSLPSSVGQGRQNIMKDLWIEIRTGRDRSPVTVSSKTGSTWGKGIYL